MSDENKRFSFTTEDILAPPKLSEEESINLILSSMEMSIENAQVCFPTLDKYTRKDLVDVFKGYLNNPPEFKEKCKKYPFKPAFTVEEDFWILTFLRNRNTIKFAEFAEKYGHHFRPCLTFEQIKERVNQINAMSKEQQNEIDEAIIKSMILEQSYEDSDDKTGDHSTNLQCRYEGYQRFNVQPHVNKEIKKLEDNMCFLSMSAFKGEELAVLRGLTMAYPIRREAVLIGRASNLSEVDVDLSSIDRTHTCIHISRQQAILSFLQDCNFYIENIGNRTFRVNGIEISTGKICRLPPYAILDFCGILLMFIPNERFIETVRQHLNSQTEGQK